MKNQLNNNTKDIIDIEKKIEKSMNFDIKEFYTETITHAPREIFGLYSNRINPGLYDAPVFFNVYPSFDFINDNPNITNKPANGDVVSFENIESIESNIDGVLLLDENKNIVARINSGQKVTNLRPGNKFYIALEGITGPVTGQSPNVKIVFNHYATAAYSTNLTKNNFKIIKE